MRHVRLGDLLIGEQGVTRSEFTMTGNQDWGHYWGFNPLVVVGVDTYFHLFRVEGELANVQRFELVMGLKIWPPPHSTVDHVGEALSMRYL
jgi:hypothetical protein